MEDHVLVNYLMDFGLTKQEATIYLELFKKGMQTGYEVSKQTGISRSNAYSALASLVEAGAAYTVEESATKYAAVEVEEFCNNRLRSMQQHRDYLVAHMPREQEQQDGYFTITSDEQIIHKVKNMLNAAKERVYLSMSKENLQRFEDDIEELCLRKIKVVILTDIVLEKQGVISYLVENKGTQLGVITDSKYVVTGELGLGANSNCLYSRQSNLVRVFKDSLKNEIRLIEIEGEKGNE